MVVLLNYKYGTQLGNKDLELLQAHIIKEHMEYLQFMI
jgi:hypothetical protein